MVQAPYQIVDCHKDLTRQCHQDLTHPVVMFSA